MQYDGKHRNRVRPLKRSEPLSRRLDPVNDCSREDTRLSLTKYSRSVNSRRDHYWRHLGKIAGLQAFGAVRLSDGRRLSIRAGRGKKWKSPIQQLKADEEPAFRLL